jgi:hypothetical protein
LVGHPTCMFHEVCVSDFRHSGAFLEAISASCEGRHQRRRPSLIGTVNTHVSNKVRGRSFGASWGLPPGRCSKRARPHIFAHARLRMLTCVRVVISSSSSFGARLNVPSLCVAFHHCGKLRCTCASVPRWSPALWVLFGLPYFTQYNYTSYFYSFWFCAVGLPTSFLEIHYESTGYQPYPLGGSAS